MMRRSSSAYEEIISRASYLLNGATSADAFLQAYHAFHLVVQLLFLTIGIFLMVVVFAFDDVLKSLFATVILFGFAWVSLKISARIQRMTRARHEDLHYWYHKLLLIENELPEAQRYFTELKIKQKAREPKAETVETLEAVFLRPHGINDGDTYRLIPGYAYNALEGELLRVITAAWWFLRVISVVYVAYEMVDFVV